MLHITNGDSAGGTLRQTDLPGDILTWKDILHEGPTPAGLSLEQMSKIRAQFIADNAFGTYDDVLDSFMQRDSLLAQFVSLICIDSFPVALLKRNAPPVD